jgi:PAS domain-containing protein
METETKIVGVIVDVDEKHTNIMQLHIQKQKLDTIFDSVKNMILIKNKKELIEVNGAFERYFGKTLKEFKLQHQCICELFCEEKGDDSYLYVNNQCTMRQYTFTQ